jgi:hypothetical protein
MNNTRLIYAVFSVIVGVLLFGTWSNIQVYTQQSSAATPRSTASSPSTTTTISPELKAKMCDPSNPSLEVVNTTESHICGIPKTVKPSLPAATPPTSAVSSSTVTKSSPLAAPKQQKMIASNNNNTITPAAASQLAKQTVAGKETTTTATVAPVRNVSNKSLLSSPSSTIAPQVNAIAKQQQQLLTVSNVTAGQNHTFAATYLPATPSKLMYLGYQGSSATSDSSSSKDKHGSDTKPSHSDSSKSSSHNDDGDKSSSIIENDISSVIVKSFNFKHSRHSDSNDNGRDRFFGDSLIGDDDGGHKHKNSAAASSSSSAAAAGDDDGGHKHKNSAAASSSSSAAAGGGSAAASSSASASS